MPIGSLLHPAKTPWQADEMEEAVRSWSSELLRQLTAEIQKSAKTRAIVVSAH